MTNAIKSTAKHVLAALQQDHTHIPLVELMSSKFEELSDRQKASERLIEQSMLQQQGVGEQVAAMNALLTRVDERLQTLEANAAANERIGQDLAAAVHAISALLDEGVTLQRTNDQRSLMLDSKLDEMLPALALSPIIEERTRTLQYQSSLSNFAIDHQIDLMSKWYRETAAQNLSVSNNQAIANAGLIAIETKHPIAYESNDHITPDSTAEGVTRPTHFVRHCIDILGPNMTAVDIGTGAAGLVYEFLMNDVVALGIDGSDYCRRNKIGYWPVVPDALHTCDVTYSFTARRSDGPLMQFDLISMWEVLEHIGESSLPGLFANIFNHLTPTGFCLGSISQLEYNALDGTPYHVTIRPKSWWRERFAEHGLEMLDEHPFNERLFCRGNGPRFQDVHNYALNPDAGFHFVVRLA